MLPALQGTQGLALATLVSACTSDRWVVHKQRARSCALLCLQTARQPWAADGSDGGEESDEEGAGDEVTHPSTLNPFFSLSPEALAEEARALQVCPCSASEALAEKTRAVSGGVLATLCATHFAASRPARPAVAAGRESSVMLIGS